MTRAGSNVWLALALALFATACANDVPSAPTDNTTAALSLDGKGKAARIRQGPGRERRQ